ncbi:peptidoglycan-binding protein [Marihabitans asiaticum]|uniref:Cell wall-associated NlpC family hydrolase n=1 Tax=Marihabitans asiaticum TaxID=415218 RepID=A0A560WEQ9_9MICO|nr:peptidoglycan-binding protein [Marihabitans asiaticum]TWD16088.1 cell wall-associated NlpC family hydrolase [Marihabitans asiaticum]
MTFYAGRHRAHQQSTSARRTATLGATAAVGLAFPLISSTAHAAPATAAVAAPATATALAPAAPAVFSGIVRIGHRGSVVKNIQRKVGASVDGVFGPNTRSKVMAFQRRNGLAVDGVVGPKTASRMGLSGRGSSSSGSTSSRSSSFSGTVRIGHRGAVVRNIQRKVGASVDGVFGPGTRSKVMAFQRRNGLAVDGVVGPSTASRMGLSGSSSSSSSTSAPRASRSASRTSTSALVSTAKSLQGIPYVWGGTSRAGFDCSGFTSYVYRQHGTSLPRTAEAQRRAATKVSNPAPGDLVFFGYPAYHVGIYAGGGQIVDASSSKRQITHRSIWTSNVSYGRF